MQKFAKLRKFAVELEAEAEADAGLLIDVPYMFKLPHTRNGNKMRQLPYHKCKTLNLPVKRVYLNLCHLNMSKINLFEMR